MKHAALALSALACTAGVLVSLAAAQESERPERRRRSPDADKPRAADAEPVPRLPQLPPPPPDWDYVSRMTFARFPEADREATLLFIHQHFPRETKQIRLASATRPDRAMEALTDLVHKSLGLLKTQQENPELFEKLMRQHRLERQAQSLAAAVGQTQGESQKKILKKLQAVLAEAFEIKQSLMKDELEALARGVNDLRVLVEKREQNRQAIIERRLSELTGNEDWMRW